MKNIHLKIFTGLLLGSIIGAACTKVNRNDDFPAGAVPPVAGGYTNADQVATSNLVAYWGFNGDLKDAVSGSVGTNQGMTFSAGLKGQALQGNSNAALKAVAFAPSSPAIVAMTSYSVSCWVKTSQNTGATGIVSIGETTGFWGNINIFLENGGTTTLARVKTIFLNHNNTYDNSIQDVENGFNNWLNYIITYDGKGTFSSYVNGSLIRTTTITGTPAELAQPFAHVGPVVFGALHFMTTPSSTTGSAGESWAGYIPGQIDEVRIFNKALTPIEVSALAILERRGQ